MKTHLEVAREYMLMLRALRFPNPKSDEDYEALLECDIKQLAHGAALLIEATAKSLPFDGPSSEALLQVRISNLEAMNDNLRVNNAALVKANALLGEALEKMANPQHVIAHNNFVEQAPGDPD
jgi:hypothetical protein